MSLECREVDGREVLRGMPCVKDERRRARWSEVNEWKCIAGGSRRTVPEMEMIDVDIV